MIRTTHGLLSASAGALCLALLGAFSSVANAASISYGDFGPVPPGVMFQNVTESSGTDPVPLYGPPTVFSGVFSAGLDFDPANFVASAAGGGADVTDGQLNFTIMAPAGVANVSLSEGGDYTLVGVGTPATSVLAGASLRAIVTQINGVNVAPILVGPSVASVGFNLPANPGVLQPWSLGTSLDVAGALGPGQTTKVDVVIDDQLVALSEPASLAFIAKKDFVFETEIVPEPGTMALAGVALCGLGLSARRRS